MVPEEGYLQSACAYGSVNGKSNKNGIVFFYVIRLSKETGLFEVADKFEVSGKKCRHKFDIEKHPLKDDMIAVFLFKEAEYIFSDPDSSDFYYPFQITYASQSKTGDKRYKVFKGSNTLPANGLNDTKKFNKKVEKFVKTLSFNDLSDDPTTSFELNVRIIIKSEYCLPYSWVHAHNIPPQHVRVLELNYQKCVVSSSLG